MPIICTFVLGNIAKELNLKVMSEVNLRITVERPDSFKSGSFKVLFCQTLFFDSAVSILFSDLYKVYGCCFRTMMQSFTFMFNSLPVVRHWL